MAVFSVVILSAGLIGMRRAKSFDEYMLGGRSVGPWLTAFTYGTAYFSAVLFIGFAGKVGWGFGYSSLWIALGNALIGVLAVWWLLGSKIRNVSHQAGINTLPEFFEWRYNSQSLKLFTAICIFVFLVPYTAAVFMGLSYLFQATFNLSYTSALLFMGGFTALYLMMGGYRSMILIDFVFALIMIVGVIVLAASVIGKGGGVAAMTTALNSINPRLTATVGPPGWWPLFCLVFLTSVAPFAMPQLVQKFYAIKDERSIKIGMVASSGFALLCGVVAYFVGATARLFLSPASNPGAFKDGKPLFDALIPELFVRVLPEGLTIVMLLLILAASMSTLAALVLISASSIAKDMYAGFIARDVSDRTLTTMMRVLSGLFVLLSVILAYFEPATIVAILGVSWGAIGSAFLGAFVWGLYWKGMNQAGAWASSVIGLAVCVALYIKGMPSPEAGTIGMIVSFMIAPVGSLVGKR
jgi:SSS family solute:Na+ symporter/sodium/proline symporter